MAAEKQLAALRQFKRAVLEAALAASVDTGLDLSFDGTSEWVPWGQMSRREKEEYPEAVAEEGFFRIGVEVSGQLIL